MSAHPALALLTYCLAAAGLLSAVSLVLDALIGIAPWQLRTTTTPATTAPAVDVQADTYSEFVSVALAQGWDDISAHRYGLHMAGRTTTTAVPAAAQKKGSNMDGYSPNDAAAIEYEERHRDLNLTDTYDHLIDLDVTPADVVALADELTEPMGEEDWERLIESADDWDSIDVDSAESEEFLASVYLYGLDPFNDDEFEDDDDSVTWERIREHRSYTDGA